MTDASVAGTTHSGNEREHVFGTNLSFLLPRLRLGVPGEICSWGHDLKFKLGQGCFFFFPAGGPAWRPWLVLKFMAGGFLNILKFGAHVISGYAL